MYIAVSRVFPNRVQKYRPFEVIVSPKFSWPDVAPLPPFRQHRPPSSPLVVGIPLPFTPFGDGFPVVQVLVSRIE